MIGRAGEKTPPISDSPGAFEKPDQAKKSLGAALYEIAKAKEKLNNAKPAQEEPGKGTTSSIESNTTRVEKPDPAGGD